MSPQLGDRIDVLVADDEPFILRSISFVLQKAGYTVEIARDGEEALQKVELLHPRLLLLDITMPKKDGLSVCSTIRSLPLGKEIYIIMLTARGQEDDMVRGVAVGADEYITKPFSPTDLLGRVQRVLGSPPAGEERT